MHTRSRTEEPAGTRPVFVLAKDCCYAVDHATGEPIWRRVIGLDSPFFPVKVETSLPGLLVFDSNRLVAAVARSKDRRRDLGPIDRRGRVRAAARRSRTDLSGDFGASPLQNRPGKRPHHDPADILTKDPLPSRAHAKQRAADRGGRRLADLHAHYIAAGVHSSQRHGAGGRLARQRCDRRRWTRPVDRTGTNVGNAAARFRCPERRDVAQAGRHPDGGGPGP